jgi:Tfp pilus assembly protein PilX
VLVRLSRRLRPGDESGSALIVVLVVMLVLTTCGLAVAAIVTNTAGTLSNARGTAQSRAAADAGLSDAVAVLTAASAASGATQADICSHAAVTGTNPKYSVTFTCSPAASPTSVALTSTGTAADGTKTTTQAVYAFHVTPATAPASMKGELVSFSGGTVDIPGGANLTQNPNDINTSMVFPNATEVNCTAANTNLYGTLLAQQDITLGTQCTFYGNVQAKRDVTLKAARASAAHIAKYGTFGGNLTAGGDVTISDARTLATVATSTTLPAGKNLTVGAQVYPGTTAPAARAGTVIRPATVPDPGLPAWFQFQFNKATDWVGYDYVNLSATPGSADNPTTYTCASPASDNPFWGTYLQGLSKDVIIDARSCAGGINPATGFKGANFVTTLKKNVVFLAKSITLNSRSLIAASGTDPKVWFVIEDTGAAGCTGEGSIDTVTQGTAIQVTALAYSPCSVHVANGAGAYWKGAIYAGTWDPAGGMQLDLEPLALPRTAEWAAQFPGSGGPAGAAGGTLVLDNLISQRDVPTP